MSFLASAADERVQDVQFDDDALSVSLRDGRVITVPLAWYPRLLNASSAQRKNWKIAGGGYGLHWPDLDEDLSTEGLLRGAPAPKSNLPHKPSTGLNSEGKRIVLLLSEGLTNKEIAAQLQISPQTVRQYLHRLLVRAGSRKRAGVERFIEPKPSSREFPKQKHS
jgi:DNA-binding CsgD family transcriptional regulator